MLTLLIILIIGINSVVLLQLIRDLVVHWQDIKTAPGRLPVQMCSSMLIYFFSAFGISDFMVSTVVYIKAGWVEARKLPGTLNTQSLLPLTLLSLAYVSSIEVSLGMLLPFVLLQMVGSWIGPHVTVRLRLSTLKFIIFLSLFVSGLSILAGKLGLVDLGGDAIALQGWKLIALWTVSLILGFIKALGVSSYPLTMTVVYLLGLSPLAAYPLMTAGCAFSLPAAATQFIKLDAYSRRIVFCSSIAGAVGAMFAVNVVKSLDVALLQWVVLIVVFFAAADMFFSARRSRLEGN